MLFKISHLVICFAGEFYYAVAVVDKDNAAWTFNDLAGKKSCHTGVRKNIGMERTDRLHDQQGHHKRRGLSWRHHGSGKLLLTKLRPRYK